MALKSFLKKVFSFGSKTVEEVPADGAPAPDVDAGERARAEAQQRAAQEAELKAREEAAARAAEAAEAERLAEEKRQAEAEERARERAAEIARLEAAEAEARRKAEERARTRAEAEAKAAAEAEAAAKAKADAEARAAEEEERKAREASRLAKEKAEADKRAAEEAEARAEAARRAEEEVKAAAAEAETVAREAAEKARAEAEEKARVEAERRADKERIAAEQASAREAADRAAGEAAAAAPQDPSPETTPAAPGAKSAGDAAAGKVAVGKAVEKIAALEPAPVPEPEKKSGWFQRLRQGLSRSSSELTSKVTGLFTKRKLDEDTLQDLEDILIQADLGVETAMRITDTLSSGRYGKEVSGDEVRAIMAAEIERTLDPVALPLELDLSHKPHVILVVGVNGTGKTTTIGKLAAKLRQGGLDVMLAAGDTFRAAAIEQLHIWGERVGAPVISTRLGADAAGLAYDAFEQAKEAGSDVLIVDTAGRLQNKAELMDELAKIVRVLGKLDPEAPHTVLQTLDATTGQNALSQVEIFRNVAGVNGLVMTKLDGTARGGILVAIAAKHRLPVFFVGVGEQVDDLEPFAAKDFASAIVGTAQ